MAKQVRIRRGTADQHTSFVGALGEVTMDTTNKTLRVHDGAQAGGIPLARRNEISQASMPSGNFVNMTLGPSIANLIAPANGYYMLAVFSGGSEYCNMTNESNGLGMFTSTNLSGQLTAFWVPACKGDRITINYNYSGTIVYFRFIYAKGEI